MVRPRGQKHAVRLSVSLDKNDHAAISRLAANMNLSTAWIVRHAVAEFVARHNTDARPAWPLAQNASKEVR